MPVADDASKTQAQAPIVVDLGKKRRKAVKKLRGGTGKLMDQVNETLQELRNAGTIAATAQPVIIVVRERRSSPVKSLLWP